MRTVIAMLASGLTLAACAGKPESAGDSTLADTTAAAPSAWDTGAAGGAGGAAAGGATATLRDASGREVGTLTLADGPQGITVSGRLAGVSPGDRAIHLHTTGRCDGPTFESAGDHWNPTNREHGSRSANGPHLGDLPNIEVARNGSVTVQETTPGGTLRGANALLDADGAAVVVHLKADDYRTQPSGDAGDRIACGVVQGS